MFARRKQGLFKQAMELSVLCDCDVAVIVFGPPGAAGQRLYQYSSANMDELLDRYAVAVAEPHERRRNGELLRHYYEFSPDDEDVDEGANGAEAGHPGGAMEGGAAAAATMAMVDSIILGGGGRGRQDGREAANAACGNAAKRMRTQSPVPAGMPFGHAAGALGLGGMPMLGGAGGQVAGGLGPNGMTAAAPPLGSVTPLRRLGPLGAGGGLPLEGIKAAGFLDKSKYPVSPRSERAYDEVTAALDALTELRSKRGGGQSHSTTLQPLSSSSAGGLPGGFSLASQQQHLQQLLLRQQQQKQLLHQQQGQHQQQKQPQQQQLGSGGAKRFKPLSIMVPEVQTHPIIPTSVTPLTSSAAAPGAAGTGAIPGGSTPPGLRSSAPASNGPHHQHHQQAQHQQAGGLPPRPPQPGGRSTPRTHGSVPPSPSSASQPLGASGHRAGGPPISPVASAALAAGGQPAGGADGTSGGTSTFAFDRRSVGALGDDTLGGLMGSSIFRTSLDGSSAAALLSMPSPPPHGGAAALFGALDGGSLSMRSSSSHGMLASLGGLGLGLERGASLGLGGSLSGMGLLESPGGNMDAALRGLAPMDVLDWPSSSPRSSQGNGDGPGAGEPGGGGGFSDEGDADGGTVMDGLIVRGTALSKLAPEALEAAIGPSPDVSGGTPGSSRGGGGGGSRGGAAATTSGGTSPPPAGQSAFAATGASSRAQQEAQAGADGVSGEGGQDEAGTRETGTRQASEGAEGQAGDASIFAAGPDGLVTELSFNDFGVHGPAGMAAAAAAALAAAAAQQRQEARQQRGADEEGGAGQGPDACSARGNL